MVSWPSRKQGIIRKVDFEGQSTVSMTGDLWEAIFLQSYVSQCLIWNTMFVKLNWTWAKGFQFNLKTDWGKSESFYMGRSITIQFNHAMDVKGSPFAIPFRKAKFANLMEYMTHFLREKKWLSKWVFMCKVQTWLSIIRGCWSMQKLSASIPLMISA